MSTQSTTGFEWSVKLIGDPFFCGIGIASKLARGSIICNNDQEAIVLDADRHSVDIRRGTKIIHSGLRKLSGDVIHFKFQPDTKKLIIDRVRNIKFSSINL